jgi:hypothetical protein
MIIHDHKIFEGVPNTTENDTYVIFGTIKVNLHNTRKYTLARINKSFTKLYYIMNSYYNNGRVQANE